MTEPEAALLADRLRRVWAPKGPFSQTLSTLSFFISSRPKVELIAELNLENSDFARFQLDGRNVVLLCDYVGIIHDYSQSKQSAQWLPLFRRNCFLSGCTKIEATATDRTEWALDALERGVLTRDECEALLRQQEAVA